jgi:hypothetical protein
MLHAPHATVTIVAMSSHTEQQQHGPAPGRRWWEPKVTQPSCRACGYAVRGLPSFTCPECGSDLREVGIDTPGAGAQLFARITRSAGAVRGMFAALWRVLGLRVPVTTFEATIEVRHDGRVVFDPPVRLPSGKHPAVLVVQDTPAEGPPP